MSGWRGLTLLQPYAWAIGYAGKRIENRGRAFKHRGPILLHAGRGTTPGYYGHAAGWMYERGLIRAHGVETAAQPRPPILPQLSALDRGGYYAYAEIVGVIAPGTHAAEIERAWHVDPRWHIPDQWGHVLEYVALLPFTPARGMLGLFPALPEHVAALGLEATPSRPRHA